jgi:hypothetical protein
MSGAGAIDTRKHFAVDLHRILARLQHALGLGEILAMEVRDLELFPSARAPFVVQDPHPKTLDRSRKPDLRSADSETALDRLAAFEPLAFFEAVRLG